MAALHITNCIWSLQVKTWFQNRRAKWRRSVAGGGSGGGGGPTSAAEAALLASHSSNNNPQSRFNAMMESYTSSPPLNLRLDSSDEHARVASHGNVPMDQSQLCDIDSGANDDEDNDDDNNIDDDSADDDGSDDSDRPDTPINII